MVTVRGIMFNEEQLMGRAVDEADYQQQIREVAKLTDSRAKAAIHWLWTEPRADTAVKAFRKLLWLCMVYGATHSEVILERERRIRKSKPSSPRA